MFFWPWATRIVMLGNPELSTAAAQTPVLTQKKIIYLLAGVIFYYCLHKIPTQIFDIPSKNFDSVGQTSLTRFLMDNFHLSFNFHDLVLTMHIFTHTCMSCTFSVHVHFVFINFHFIICLHFHQCKDIAFITVLTMSVGPPAQDQKTLFEPVNIFNFYLDIFIKSLNEFKNLIQTSKFKSSIRGLLLLSIAGI